MNPTKKDYTKAIESVLWYNELWPIVEKWKYRPVDHGQITAPPAYGCPHPENKTWTYTYFQLQLIWMIAVELFGECGTSPRSGWITDVTGFRSWITDLTHESTLYAAERSERENKNTKQPSHKEEKPITKWYDIYLPDTQTYILPNFCETVLVELRSGDRQVAELDINPWTRVPGWCIPNGNWLGPIDIVKRWMEIIE